MKLISKIVMTGYKKNKLQQLRGFCNVIEEGSILKAAKKMNTAQSNVSLQIISLERDLKTQLFKREKKRLIPTPTAFRFYKIAKKSLHDIDFIFEHTINALKEDGENIVKLAGHTYMLSHILPQYFKKVLEVNSCTEFELHNVPYEEMMDMLNNGIIDIGIYPSIKDRLSTNIISTEFYKCKFGVAVPKNHFLAGIPDKDITWDLIAKYDFVNLGKGVTAQGAKTTIDSLGVKSKFKLFNGTWEICVGLVDAELAISGTDIGYLKFFSSKVIIKECPSLLPEYIFNVMINKNTDISKSSYELLKILAPKLLEQVKKVV